MSTKYKWLNFTNSSRSPFSSQICRTPQFSIFKENKHLPLLPDPRVGKLSCTQPVNVWLCGWMGDGEPVACVVNSPCFQQSLTRGNHTSSLDPVCHLGGCCLDAYREWRGLSLSYWEQDSRLLCQFKGTPDCNCTTLTSAPHLNTRIRHNYSLI